MQARELELRAAARGLVTEILKQVSRGLVNARDDTAMRLRGRVRAGQGREKRQIHIYEGDASQRDGQGVGGAANRAVRRATKSKS
jgi:hypothetical protein